MKLGDLLAEVASGGKLKPSEIEQVRRMTNETYTLARRVSDWADDYGGISTSASPQPVDQLFSKTLSANATGVSVKFQGSKYSMAMISGAAFWEASATGKGQGDALHLRVNGNTSTSVYEYWLDYTRGTTAAGESSGYGFSTKGSIVLTEWNASSLSDPTIPHTFMGTIPAVNGGHKKAGVLLFDGYNALAAGAGSSGRQTTRCSFWIKSTAPINSFDFSLISTTNASTSLGHMLPGSYFSAWGFK